MFPLKSLVMPVVLFVALVSYLCFAGLAGAVSLEVAAALSIWAWVVGRIVGNVANWFFRSGVGFVGLLLTLVLNVGLAVFVSLVIMDWCNEALSVEVPHPLAIAFFGVFIGGTGVRIIVNALLPDKPESSQRARF